MSTPTTSTSAAGLAARNRERIDRARQHLARIEQADAAGGKAEVLGALNDLSLELATAGAECGLLSEVHPDAETRSSAESIVQEVSRFADRKSVV